MLANFYVGTVNKAVALGKMPFHNNTQNNSSNPNNSNGPALSSSNDTISNSTNQTAPKSPHQPESSEGLQSEGLGMCASLGSVVSSYVFSR